MQLVPLHQINVSENRIRREFDPAYIAELQASIAKLGLMHPIVIDEKEDPFRIELVAGENRLRAIEALHDLEIEFSCNGERVPRGFAPVILISTLPPALRLTAELEENVVRRGLSWQEEAEARAKLFALRKETAAAAGETLTVEKYAESLAQAGVPSASREHVFKQIRTAELLHRPEVAAAKSLKDADKAVTAARKALLLEALGHAVAKQDTTHTLLRGDCVELIRTIPDNSVHVVLTDPPYGINVDEAGSQVQGQHHYEDSPNVLLRMLALMPGELFRVTKPDAHLYWFCAHEWFQQVAYSLQQAGWNVWARPIIWDKGGRGIAPYPFHGPRYTYECIVYARKGERNTIALKSDVIRVSIDKDLQQAEKPVALLEDLLSRSAMPGETVLDFCCGSGSIFLAASRCKLRAIGMELDEARGNLAASRLNGEA